MRRLIRSIAIVFLLLRALVGADLSLAMALPSAVAVSSGAASAAEQLRQGCNETVGNATDVACAHAGVSPASCGECDVGEACAVCHAIGMPLQMAYLIRAPQLLARRWEGRADFASALVPLPVKPPIAKPAG